MICKKCIHNHICELYASHGMRIPNMMEFGGDRCVAFKDKTLFIELPCSVIPDKKIKLLNTEPHYQLKFDTTYKWTIIRHCWTLEEARRCEERARKEYKDLYGVEMEDEIC